MMNSLDKKTKLSIKVQQDMCARAKEGVWAHPLLLVLVLTTTNLTQHMPVLCRVFTISVIVQTILRIVVTYMTIPGLQLTESRRNLLNLWLMLCSTTLWGVISGVTLWKIGYQDQDVMTLTLYKAIVGLGLVNVFVHDRVLTASFLAILVAPSLLGAFLYGGVGQYHHLAAVAAYLLYCFAQSKKLHELYMSQISDNYDLSVAAYRDCLTGLPNRLYMNEALETCFETAGTRTFQIALLYIDLDGFKQINDRHSHRVGDLFLCEAAVRIRRSLRKNDIAARIGGDEFTILLPECTSEEEALAIAQRVLTDARLPVIVNGHELNYSASIGVSLFPNTAADLDTLVRSADEAMYAAKASGKDRICMQVRGGEKRIVDSAYPFPPSSLIHTPVAALAPTCP